MKPKQIPWRTAVRDVLVALTVVVLLGVIFTYRAALQDRDDRLVATSDPLLRLQTVDRLVGLALPPLYVTGSDGSPVEFGTLASGGGTWLLAPQECAGCLDDIGASRRADAWPPSLEFASPSPWTRTTCSDALWGCRCRPPTWPSPAIERLSWRTRAPRRCAAARGFRLG